MQDSLYSEGYAKYSEENQKTRAKWPSVKTFSQVNGLWVFNTCFSTDGDYTPPDTRFDPRS